MADTKISGATANAAPVGTDQFATDQGGASRRTTLDQVKTYVRDMHFIRADVDRTLPNDTNLNAIFNDPANGRLTLGTGVFTFSGMLIVTGMSSTSGNALINILGAGTATIGSWLWNLHGIDNSAPATILDDDSSFYQVGVTAASAVTAGTGTALRARFNGTFEVTTGGTLIPSIDLVTAMAAVVQDGSWFMVERMGASGMVSVGAWD